MKNTNINKIFIAILLLVGLISCVDRELIKVENETAPITLNISQEKLILDKNFPTNPALTISWDAAKYTVPTEVYYKIEVSADENFTTPELLGSVGQSQTSATFTVEQMNAAAQAIGLEKDVEAKMYVRVSSYVGTTAENLLAKSNVTYLTIKPYELEYPTFFLVGGASEVGWDSGKAMILAKNGEFSTIVTTLKGGESFRFLGQQAWDPLNYSIDQAGTRDNNRYFKEVSSNIVQDGDENMKFTGITGTYKITINAAVQSLKIEAQ